MPGEALMNDPGFPLPVAALTIVIARVVLFWQRLRDWLSAVPGTSATAHTPQNRDVLAAPGPSRSHSHPLLGIQ